MSKSGTNTHKDDTPEIWVVCPTFRPHMMERVIEMVGEQSVICNLLFVVNGPAVENKEAFKGCVCIESDPNVGAARRRGLEWVLERNPEAFIAWMDDDDYYGPKYVETMLKSHRGGAISSVWSHFVQLDTEIFYFDRRVSLCGATLFGVAKDFTPPPDMLCGEEEHMVTVRHYVHAPYVTIRYMDREHHTWSLDNAGYFMSCGPGIHCPDGVTEDGSRPTGDPSDFGEARVKFPHAFRVRPKKQKQT